MCNRPRGSAQYRADHSGRREAVRTTIVGGRPPDSGQNVGDVPRGIEVLVKKASVDSHFRETLLEGRAAAAEAIGLELDAAEKVMMQMVPAGQLEAIIDHTYVPAQHRRVFLGASATAMLAVLAGGSGCDHSEGVVLGTRPEGERATRGIGPDLPEEPEPPEPGPNEDDPGAAEPLGDESPVDPPGDKPSELVSFGVRPDRPPATKRIGPDMPPE